MFRIGLYVLSLCLMEAERLIISVSTNILPKPFSIITTKFKLPWLAKFFPYSRLSLWHTMFMPYLKSSFGFFLEMLWDLEILIAVTKTIIIWDTSCTLVNDSYVLNSYKTSHFGTR
jgi:hypothetical protein